MGTKITRQNIMIHKALEEILADDIESLVVNGIREGRTIEFKEKFSLNNDKEKGEFLADISSFANTLGGDLIFGIREEAGAAKETKGFTPDSNKDELQQQIENLARDGIAPRINFDVKFITVDKKEEESKFVLIIRVKNSWSKPHRVIFNGYSKTKDQFYARNSVGKEQLDLMALRDQFNSSATFMDKIKKFKEERVANIVLGDAPVLLKPERAKIIVHMVPFNSFENSGNVDPYKIIEKSSSLKKKLYPFMINQEEHIGNINLDGILTHIGDKQEWLSYSQLYRTGIIEGVDAYTLKDWNGNKKIDSTNFTSYLSDSFKNYMKLLEMLEIEPPIATFLTMIGVKGYALDQARNNANKIDRNILQFPEHILQSYGSLELDDILNQMFDLVWNACGQLRRLCN